MSVEDQLAREREEQYWRLQYALAQRLLGMSRGPFACGGDIVREEAALALRTAAEHLNCLHGICDYQI